MKRPDTQWVEGIRVPLPATLKKYGLTEDDWLDLLAAQGFKCAVCGVKPESGTLHVDHDHIRNYKKQPPEVRRAHVRGLVCMFDNRFYLARKITLKRARAIVAYLERYEKRKP